MDVDDKDNTMMITLLEEERGRTKTEKKFYPGRMAYKSDYYRDQTPGQRKMVEIIKFMPGKLLPATFVTAAGHFISFKSKQDYLSYSLSSRACYIWYLTS